MLNSTHLSGRAARSWTRTLAALVAATLAVVGLVVAGPLAPVEADTAPVEPATPVTVAADALPTVQIDGVAWSQVVVGGTVYVAGDFTTARPAGAAAGVSTVARANLLAYDLVTGKLVTTWAPALNGPAYVITASPDGTRLYVGGDFTKVNGAAQYRFVALDRTKGTRIAGIDPHPNAAVRAIASTASTVYLGGNFTTVAGKARTRLAAINATTGALSSWLVAAQSAQVEALLLSPDNSRLIVAGRFTKLNNVTALGSGAVSTTSGAVLPWAANTLVKNSGYNAGITSLSTDGTLIYGTGFVLVSEGGAGNLEGTFAADPMTGKIAWVEDCHGDSYSVYPNPGKDAVYVAGHPYDCSRIGAFPSGLLHYAVSFTKKATTTITPNDVDGYYDWQGTPAPTQLDFYPTFTEGTFTGQTQATWTVTGTGDYLLYGGEFLTVNGTGQQGLVRMALSGKSTNKQGPQLPGSTIQPAATSKAAGSTQVSWPTNWDPDNETLTYKVLRDSSTTPVYSTTVRSTFWQLPRAAFTDTGLANGSTHTYKVVMTDAFGNAVTSAPVRVTVAGSSAGPLSAYAKEVLLDSPAAYWRLGESSGVAQDWTGYANATVGAGVIRAVTGALAADPNPAARFKGTPSSRVFATTPESGPNRFSVEAWFKSTSTAGGKIVGFGDSSDSDSFLSDRHVYLSGDGRINFGVYPNTVRVITSKAGYNDGKWHHVVASLDAGGMRLYVDGALAAERTDTISAGVYTGYWRIGGDSFGPGTWPGAAGADLAGDIDDVAVYGRALTPTEVASHRAIGVNGP